MSSKALRLPGGAAAVIEPFDWSGKAPVTRLPPGAHRAIEALLGQAPPPAAAAPPVVAPAMPAAPAIDVAALERDAYARGFVDGEREGALAASGRAEQAVERLARSVEDLQALRTKLLQKTERQVVQLSVAIARRIVHRELRLDPDLLAAMARVALDRLGDAPGATIRLNPEDYAATAARRVAPDAGAVRVVADPSVKRGGCLVQSEVGLIDLNPDAQIQELASTLLGPESDAEGEALEERLAS